MGDQVMENGVGFKILAFEEITLSQENVGFNAFVGFGVFLLELLDIADRHVVKAVLQGLLGNQKELLFVVLGQGEAIHPPYKYSGDNQDPPKTVTTLNHIHNFIIAGCFWMPNTNYDHSCRNSFMDMESDTPGVPEGTNAHGKYRLRYFPVYEILSCINASGEPQNTTSPPLSPPSGPRSMI